LAAALIGAVALWVEFRPDPLVEHPFAAGPIVVGDQIDGVNTEMRMVPSSLFEPVTLGGVALRDISQGAPVLSVDVGDASRVVPPGWWMVSVEVPAGAHRGDVVRLVLLDTGTVADGVVASTAATDAFGPTGGSVAVHPDHAGQVAVAAINGRVAVLISTG
jgi:hypothetical protein